MAPANVRPKGVLACDLRYALRIFLHAPAFTLVALLAIALGIGATTAAFSLVNAVLIRSLPYGHAQDLVYIWTPNPKLEGTPRELSPSNADFCDWRRLSHSFSELTTFDPKAFTLQGSGTVKRVAGARVTSNFFHTLQVTPALGRAFGADDEQPGHERVVVIGDALWRSEFGGDRGVVGKTLRLNRETYRVIGVMPKSFVYPHQGDFPHEMEGFKSTEFWIPLVLTPKDMSDRMDGGDGVAVGRLRPDVTVQQAQSEMSAIESKLGALTRIPRLAIKPEEILWLNLDHRAGFLLAQIDGVVDYDALFALSGLPRLDTARILANLIADGVVTS